MKIEIGNKKLAELSADEILQIVMIEGCCPSLEYWNEPEIIDFDNKMFSDTIVIDFISYRKCDMIKSSLYTFFFNFKNFSFHYVRDFERDNYQPNGKRIKISTLKYLIKQGFDVPIH